MCAAKAAVPAARRRAWSRRSRCASKAPNSASHKHAFEVALDKLISRREGMVIGRAADQCELVVAHATVSRRHARLSLAGEALQIEDLGSTNGTAVDGRAARTGQPMAFQAGSTIRLGDVKLAVRRSEE